MVITLPISNRRGLLRSFWFVVSGSGGLIMALATSWFHPLLALALGAATGMGVAALVFVNEALAWKLYRAWNRRLAAPFANTARQIVLGLCYFVIFAAVGRGGSRLLLEEPGAARSLWMLRSSLEPRAYLAHDSGSASVFRTWEWMRTYLGWALASGNAWAATLLPFLIALRLFSAPEEKSLEANIYTLF